MNIIIFVDLEIFSQIIEPESPRLLKRTFVKLILKAYDGVSLHEILEGLEAANAEQFTEQKPVLFVCTTSTEGTP